MRRITGTLGVVLIVLGAIALTVKGFEYTKQETVLEVGPIEATAETEETVTIPAWVAGAVLAAGVVLLIVAKSRPNV